MEGVFRMDDAGTLASHERLLGRRQRGMGRDGEVLVGDGVEESDSESDSKMDVP